MTIVRASVPNSLPINLGALKLTEEQFYQLCFNNPDQPLELTAEGVLVIMSPVGGASGKREANLIIQLGIWNQTNKLGEILSKKLL